jgi:hypothetical protein
MEIEQLRKEFNLVLANITEHSERFTGSDHLPALEVSVMMSKINKLQEIAAILKHTIHSKEEKRRSFNKIEPTIVSETKKEVLVDETELIIEKSIEISVETKEITTEIKSSTTSKSSISDKFSHSPIASLKDAFSLNDRYLFANELFKKDMALFNQTVASIDVCNNLIEAQELLNQAKTNFNWDAENERVISFYELVGRRFLHIG